MVAYAYVAKTTIKAGLFGKRQISNKSFKPMLVLLQGERDRRGSIITKKGD